MVTGYLYHYSGHESVSMCGVGLTLETGEDGGTALGGRVCDSEDQIWS